MALNIGCLFKQPEVDRGFREMNVQGRMCPISLFTDGHHHRNDGVDYAVVTGEARLLVVVNGVPHEVPHGTNTIHFCFSAQMHIIRFFFI